MAIDKERKAARIAAAARETAMQAARALGREYYDSNGDLMLVEVSRHASTLFAKSDEIIAFLQGYCAGRLQHDDYKRGE